MKKLALVLIGLGATAGAEKPAPKPAVDKGRPVTIKVPPLPPSTEDLRFATPSSAAWVPAEKMGMPPGAQVALIAQDPVSTGPTLYLKTPAGYQLPLHWHTHGEKAILAAGKGTFTVAGKAQVAEPGAWLSLPSKTRHAFVCDGRDPCLLVVQQSGPADINWVKAAK